MDKNLSDARDYFNEMNECLDAMSAYVKLALLDMAKDGDNSPYKELWTSEIFKGLAASIVLIAYDSAISGLEGILDTAETLFQAIDELLLTAMHFAVNNINKPSKSIELPDFLSDFMKGALTDKEG